jgi:deazaflavin-dependent oxidoreductase (nitroreductase family)
MCQAVTGYELHMADYNQAIIDEFRGNGGRVGGAFESAPLLLLHTIGAKSGKERVNPVMYQAVGEDYAVFASKAGAPDNPAWYHNLLAHPDVTVEVGTALVPVTARVAEGQERELIWQRQKADYPGFEEYEQRTPREIPVVILTPRH